MTTQSAKQAMWTPARRKAMSEIMKARQSALKAANGHGTRLALHTNIVLTINDRELTLTVSEAHELLDLLTAAVSPSKVHDQRDEAIA